jgi:2'-5' RNA ligase
MTRRQLTLFLPMPAKGIIDQVRQRVDPLQFAKISAHITLCYDDELRNWDDVAESLEAFSPDEIRFSFTVDGARSFEAEGRGIYLSLTEHSGFYDLARSRLLGTSSAARRQVEPHVTLLHPRHTRDSTEGWPLVDAAMFPARIDIQQISMVELDESTWTIVRTWGSKEPNESAHPPLAQGQRG